MKKKRCPKCGKLLPISAYWKFVRNGKELQQSRCKNCSKKEIKIQRAKDPQKFRDYVSKSYWKSPEKYREQARLRRQKLKMQVLVIYGGKYPKCKCCGEKEIMFLTLDHVNGDGAKERRIRSAGSAFYQKLKKLNFPDKDRYQVLCYNCNCGRQLNGGICPHQK